MSNNRAVKDTTKNTKTIIFEEAIELFSRNGFSGVSIREITRHTGIKESSLYNHFTSKEDLLKKIFDYYQDVISKMIPSETEIREMLAQYTPKETLMKMLMNSKNHANNPLIDKISRIVTIEQFRNERARDISLNEKLKKPLECIKLVFTLMIEQEQIQKCDPEIMAKEYFHVIQSLVSEYNILKSFDMDTNQVEDDMKQHISFIYETVRK